MSLRLLDDRDLGWIGEVVDVVAASAGKPWRVALERLDDTRRIEQPHAPVRFAAVVSALQRLLGGRARNGPLARAARALVLGAPALTPAEREARIAHAARELEVTCTAVELLLWSDLPRERPVELPRGRPSEFEVAAVANVQILQRAMRRARSVRLRVWGDAGPLVRAASARGLLTTVSVHDIRDSGIPGADARITVLDIVGPLALFHHTAVYGRALADLVPLLAGCERFELELVARSHDRTYAVDVASPVLLPAVPARLVRPGFDLQRLIKALERESKSHGLVAVVGARQPDEDARASGAAIAIHPRPPALHSGRSLVCPDLVLERGERRLHVEILGFWTPEFVARKHALYRGANAGDVVLCVDESRGCDPGELAPELPVLRYSKRVGPLAAALLERLYTD